MGYSARDHSIIVLNSSVNKSLNRTSSFAVLVIAVSLAAACGDDGAGGTATVESICQRGCATLAALNCPNEPEDCYGDCADNINQLASVCEPELLAYADCTANEPASSFECNAAGNAQAIGRLCTDQNVALEGCYAGAAGSGG
jgi:hypothetical protein